MELGDQFFTSKKQLWVFHSVKNLRLIFASNFQICLDIPDSKHTKNINHARATEFVRNWF